MTTDYGPVMAISQIVLRHKLYLGYFGLDLKTKVFLYSLQQVLDLKTVSKSMQSQVADFSCCLLNAC